MLAKHDRIQDLGNTFSINSVTTLDELIDFQPSYIIYSRGKWGNDKKRHAWVLHGPEGCAVVSVITFTTGNPAIPVLVCCKCDPINTAIANYLLYNPYIAQTSSGTKIHNTAIQHQP